MSSLVKKRQAWIDFAKIFAIFLVLWGHCIQQFNPSYKESGTFIWIYSFHMPLFMILAGIFISEDKLRNGLDFISKRFKQLILPCFLWIIIAFLVSKMIGHHTNSFIQCMWYNLWFLKSLFACNLILTLSYILTRRFNVCIIISLITSQLTLAEPNLWHLQLQTMLPSVVVGMYLSKLFRQNDKSKTILLSVLTIICAVIFILSTRNWSIEDINPPLDRLLGPDKFNIYLRIVQRLLVGITGSIMIIGIIYLAFSIFEARHACMKEVSKYGMISMEVYILQTIILETILSHFIAIELNFVWTDVLIFPIVAIIVLALTIAVYKGFESLGLSFLFNFNKLKSIKLKRYA